MYKRKLKDIYFGSKKTKSVESDDDTQSDVSEKLSRSKSDTKIERENNHIYFYSEVDRTSIYELTSLIKEAEIDSIVTSMKLCVDEIPIYIHINSNGGSVFDCFTCIDAIQSCKVPVHTIIEGASASAATLISIIGKKRYMTKNAYMLIHQLSSCFWGKMNEIEDEYKNLEELMKKIKSFYKDYTNIPKKELSELLKHDIWFDSDKCLKYGLIDELWE